MQAEQTPPSNTVVNFSPTSFVNDAELAILVIAASILCNCNFLYPLRDKSMVTIVSSEHVISYTIDQSIIVMST